MLSVRADQMQKALELDGQELTEGVGVPEKC